MSLFNDEKSKLGPDTDFTNQAQIEKHNGTSNQDLDDNIKDEEFQFYEDQFIHQNDEDFEDQDTVDEPTLNKN